MQSFWRFDSNFLSYQWIFFYQTPFASFSDHKEQIEKAEEKERLEKEKEEKQKKEAEEKTDEKNIKADEEDTGHENEAGKQSRVEDNAATSDHDKIEVQDDAPADKVLLCRPFNLQLDCIIRMHLIEQVYSNLWARY